MNTTPYLLISADLNEIEPIDPTVPPPPYNSSTSAVAKIKITYRQLLRAKRLHNRISILEYAFYIGQLIENELTPSQRTNIKSSLTDYYYRVCVWTYYIFEVLGVQQIYRTKNTTLAIISRLKSREYRDLANEGLSLIGVNDGDTLTYESLDAQ
jgi:hypothetical protein